MKTTGISEVAFLTPPKGEYRFIIFFHKGASGNSPVLVTQCGTRPLAVSLKIDPNQKVTAVTDKAMTLSGFC